MTFILGSIPNGAGTMMLWFLWSLILGINPTKVRSYVNARSQDGHSNFMLRQCSCWTEIDSERLGKLDLFMYELSRLY